MRLRKKHWARPELEKDPKVIFNPAEFKGKWRDVFGNDHPIHLELGCGKGNFISQIALQNQDINYIAVDLPAEVLVYTLRKVNNNGLTNVRIISMNIQTIETVFARDEIDKIYINFCNPWPKKKHHKRRLTYPTFLRQYQGFLKPEGEIWFKTDDDMLFADSLEYFRDLGFEEIYKTYDLENSGFTENIRTEYEEKYMAKGMKIKFVIMKHKGVKQREDEPDMSIIAADDGDQ